MMNTACLPASDLDTAEPEWRPARPDLRDVARQLRPVLTARIPFAIATVLGAHGTVLRRPGTVLVISGSGETIGFNPAGPLDGAIRDLAATVLATGHDQLERLEIDPDAASYIGLSGGASLDVHARRVQAGDPVFGDLLREAGEDDLGGEATIHRPSGRRWLPYGRPSLQLTAPIPSDSD